MTISEFLSTLNEAQKGVLGRESLVKDLRLNVLDSGRIGVQFGPSSWAEFSTVVPALARLAGVPEDYATRLEQGQQALLCACLVAGLRGNTTYVTLASAPHAGRNFATISNSGVVLNSRAQLFTSFDATCGRYGYEPHRLTISPDGMTARAQYVRRGAAVPTSSGPLFPAVTLWHTYNRDAPAPITFVHGFVAERGAQVSAVLVGQRKFKYLRVPNATLNSVLGNIAVGEIASSEAIEAMLDSAVSIDMAAAHAKELVSAHRVSFSGSGEALLAALLPDGHARPLPIPADAPKTRLEIALRSCVGEDDTGAVAYAIMTKTDDQWAKLVAKHDTPVAVTAAAQA